MIWRLEDLDGPRTVAGMAEAAMEDVTWLGLDWDEGGKDQGPFAPYAQSERFDRYEDALDVLYNKGRLFPCTLSRKDLQSIASAPHAGEEPVSPYPKRLRPATLPDDWYQSLKANPRTNAAIRFIVDDREVTVDDAVFGHFHEQVDRTVGDFVLKRRDGLYAYQLGVVVDDTLMGITEVVRGVDLLTSTARQVQLFRALDAPVPRFAHVPLVLNASGEKISKRDGGLTLRHLRERGITSQQVTGYLAWSIGLIPEPAACHAGDLVPVFSWDKIEKTDWILPQDVEREIAAIS